MNSEKGGQGVKKEVLASAVEQLRSQYLTLNWKYYDFDRDGQTEKMYRWPGPEDKEIIIVVHQSGGRQELFHRHDFFILIIPMKGNTIPSAINTIITLPSIRASFVQGSLLRDMRSASTMIRKRPSSVF